MSSFRRFTRRAWLLHGYLLASMILWPVPTVRSYWTWDTTTNAKVEVEDPAVGDSWWEEDSDSDGMTNAQEAAFGSDPYNRDSDHDGLTDTDERDITPPMLGYTGTTNPWSWDSNLNGYSDHDEYWAWQSGLTLNVNYNNLTPPSSLPSDYYRDVDGDGTYNLWDYAPTDNGVTSPPTDPGTGTGTPLDPSTTDSDGDGCMDASDSHPYTYWLWEDWNWNGTNDSQEPPPPSDSDGDGYFDTSDSHPYWNWLWDDWNWNGTNDSQESPPSYPTDPTSPPDPYYTDSDWDATMDAYDSDPNNPSLWEDWNRNGTNDSSEPSDSDGDGVTDADEQAAGTHPYFHDSDGDGLSDGEERTAQTNPLHVDTDGDGLTDHEEVFIYQKNPLLPRSLPGLQQTDYYQVNLADTDLDGIPDLVEAWYGRDPASDADAASDLDVDGHSDLDAYLAGWAFTVSFTSYDQDRDGITDARESYWGFNPYDPDDATQDADHDGLLNIEEIRLGLDPLSASTHGTPDLEYANTTWNLGWQPCMNRGSPATLSDDDTDGDGMSDAWEHRHRLNWRDATDAIRDPDRDSLSNLTEYRFQSHPRIPKSESNTHDRTRLYATGKPLNAATAGGLMNRYRAQMAADLPPGNSLFKDYSLNAFKPPSTLASKPKIVIEVTNEASSQQNGRKFEASGDQYTLINKPASSGDGGEQTAEPEESADDEEDEGEVAPPPDCGKCGNKRMVDCPSCNDETASATCTACSGRSMLDDNSPCYACSGTGSILCQTCFGSQTIPCDSCPPPPAQPASTSSSSGGHSTSSGSGPSPAIKQSADVRVAFPPGTNAYLFNRYQVYVNGSPFAVLSQTSPMCHVSAPSSGRYKHITVDPMDEESAHFGVGDSAGSRYRKISLSGLPLSDDKPQQQDESGEMAEETYVDAFSRQLRHSVSDVYDQAEGSLLPLVVRRDAAPEIWNEVNGLRPGEQPDRPFGLGWRSSLCAHVRFETVTTEDSSKITAVVMDEQGGQQTFRLTKLNWVHSREELQDAKTSLNIFTATPMMVASNWSISNYGLTNVTTLSVPFMSSVSYAPMSKLSEYYSAQQQIVALENNGPNGPPTSSLARDRADGAARLLDAGPLYYHGIRLQKKFGTTCTYEMVSLRQIMSSDRQLGSHDKTTLSYARLTEVSDRYGNRLVYTYGSPSTLIPSRIHDPDRPGRALSLTQDQGVVTRVRGPGGEEVEFQYTSPAGYLGLGGARILQSITKHERTTQYRYDCAHHDDPTPLPNEVRRMRYYHLNLSGIVDELGREYSFLHGMDTSVSTAEVHNQQTFYRVQMGRPRLVTGIFLPDGSSVVFGGFRQIAVSSAYPFISQGNVSTTVSRVLPGSDAAAYSTAYSFSSPHCYVVPKTDNYYEATPEVRARDALSEHCVLTFCVMEISPSGRGKETFVFNPAASMALAEAVDQSGNITRFTYGADGFDDPLSETTYLNRSAGSPLAVTKTFTYDSATRIMSSLTLPDGVKTVYGHDTLGRRLSESVTDASGNVVKLTSFFYEHPVFKGLLTRTVEHSMTPTVVPDTVTTVSLGAAQDALGANPGWWRQETRRIGTNAQGIFTTLSTTTTIHDFGGRKRSLIDPRGYLTNFQYDAAGRLSRVDHPDSTFKELAYDAHGNLVRECQGRVVSSVDQASQLVFHAYDVFNRRIKTTLDLNGNGVPDERYTTSTRSSDGNISYDGDIVTTSEYNARGQPFRLVDARGAVTVHSYSPGGLLVKTDREGVSTTFAYDGGNTGGSVFSSSDIKPTKTWDPRGYTTQVTYDSLGRAISTRVEWELDSLSQPLRAAARLTRQNLENKRKQLVAKRRSLDETGQTYEAISRRLTPLAEVQQLKDDAQADVDDATSDLAAKNTARVAATTAVTTAQQAVDDVDIDLQAAREAFASADQSRQLKKAALDEAVAESQRLAGAATSAEATAMSSSTMLASLISARDAAALTLAGLPTGYPDDVTAAETAVHDAQVNLSSAVDYAAALQQLSMAQAQLAAAQAQHTAAVAAYAAARTTANETAQALENFGSTAEIDAAASILARAASDQAAAGIPGKQQDYDLAQQNATSLEESLQQAESDADYAGKINARNQAESGLKAANDEIAVAQRIVDQKTTILADKVNRLNDSIQVHSNPGLKAQLEAELQATAQECSAITAAIAALEAEVSLATSANTLAWQLAGVEQGDSSETRFAETKTEYDLNGKPTKVTDPLGRVTLNYYDALGNLVKVTEPDLTTNTADNPTVQTFYTHHGKPWRVIDQMGNVTTTRYDALGRPVEVKGPPLTVSSSPSLQVSAVTTTEYDAAGNVVAVTDPLGRVTETLYDERNRPTHVYAPTMWDAVSGQFVRPYAETTYDALGQPLSVTDHTGATTTNHYDRAGRKWKVEAPAVAVSSSTSQVSSSVRPTTLTYFDPGGLPVTVTNPLGQTITNTYNIHGQLIQTVDAEGIVNSFDYDAAGNRTSVKDGLNQQTTFAYDGLNRLIRQTFANGDTWTHGYNAVQKIAQISPRGITTAYTYDARDRLLTVTATQAAASGSSPSALSPLLQRSYTYDNAGKLLTVQESPSLPVSSSQSLSVSYTYDAMGRVTAESSHGQVHHYEYDLAGNRVKATYSTGRVVETSYDGLNRPEAIVDGDRLTRYGYDKAGRAVILIAANGQTSSNTYDALGRLTDRVLYKTPAMDPAQRLAQFKWQHDLLGNVTKQEEIWPGEATREGEMRSTTMGYDANNRLTSETISTFQGLFEELIITTYTYDEANNRTSKTVNGGAEPGHWDYDYNAANQLTAWEHLDYPGGSVLRSASLTYDEAGNRTSQIVTQVSGSYNPTYNPQPAVSGLTTYTWDAQDRLASVTLPGQPGTENSEPRTFTYAYDYRTRRVGTVEQTLLSAAEKRTSITFSGGLSVAEYESTVPVNSSPSALSSTPTVEYTRGPDMGGGVGGLLYTSRREASGSTPSAPCTLRYNLSNSRGDIVAQSDSYASLTWTASYEAYGKRTKETGENKDKQRGNSKDEDPTGLLNEGFRYRDIETGVWLSRDPAGFVDGPNLYAYVMQNPWTTFDPDALSSWSVHYPNATQANSMTNNKEYRNSYMQTAGKCLLVGTVAAVTATGVGAAAAPYIGTGYVAAAVSNGAGAYVANGVSNKMEGKNFNDNAGTATLTGAVLGVGMHGLMKGPAPGESPQASPTPKSGPASSPSSSAQATSEVAAAQVEAVAPQAPKAGWGEQPGSPHVANVRVTGPDGKTVYKGRTTSGDMTPTEKEMGFPAGQNASHTEAKAVMNPETPAGNGYTMTVTGGKAPCNSCKGYMNTHSEATGTKVKYQWRENGKTKRWETK